MVGEREHRQLLSLLYYKIVNRLSGIDLADTSLGDGSRFNELAHHYTDSGGPDLDVVLESLGINEEDSIVDIGCGKGGALITLSKYPFLHIGGVDIDKKLLDIAKSNLCKLHIKNVELFCSDASAFIELDTYNYVYMYNPFPFNVMKDVISNIILSLSKYPRNMTIIYRNPVCHAIIVNNSRFKLVKECSHCTHPFFIYTYKI